MLHPGIATIPNYWTIVRLRRCTRGADSSAMMPKRQKVKRLSKVCGITIQSFFEEKGSEQHGDITICILPTRWYSLGSLSVDSEEWCLMLPRNRQCTIPILLDTSTLLKYLKLIVMNKLWIAKLNHFWLMINWKPYINSNKLKSNEKFWKSLRILNRNRA